MFSTWYVKIYVHGTIHTLKKSFDGFWFYTKWITFVLSILVFATDFMLVTCNAQAVTAGIFEDQFSWPRLIRILVWSKTLSACYSNKTVLSLLSNLPLALGPCECFGYRILLLFSTQQYFVSYVPAPWARNQPFFHDVTDSGTICSQRR